MGGASGNLGCALHAVDPPGERVEEGTQMLARALVGEPSVLMLDEPTEGIQPNIIQHIGEVLRQLADDQGMTIVLVEQYLDFIREIGDRYVILARGRVVADGEARHLDETTIHSHLSV